MNIMENSQFVGAVIIAISVLVGLVSRIVNKTGTALLLLIVSSIGCIVGFYITLKGYLW